METEGKFPSNPLKERVPLLVRRMDFKMEILKETAPKGTGQNLGFAKLGFYGFGVVSEVFL